MRPFQPVIMLLVVPLFAAVCSVARPVDSDPGKLPVASRDVEDVVFFGESRPLLIRIHIQINGKPFRDVWDEALHDLFRYVDLDGNGVLDANEVVHAPPPPFVLQLLRGSYMETAAKRSRRSLELQVNLVGGKVTPQGLGTYYRLSGVDPFVALVQDQSSQAGPLTEALFRELDANKDGKLSREELQAAPAVLHRLDLNDDEIISQEELLPVQGPMTPAMNNAGQLRALSDASAFLVKSPAESASRLGYILISRYDKDDDQKLSRTEINLDKAIFDQLDLDHDDLLDQDELVHFLKHFPPDVELTVHLGDLPNGQEPLVLQPPAGRPGTPTTATPRLDSGSLVVTVGDAHMGLLASPGLPANLGSVRQFLVGQFHSADVARHGYLDAVQFQQNRFLQPLFPYADRNGDGKGDLAELNRYLDVLTKLANSSVTIVISDQGRGLFGLLDPHHEGRLRQRDLATCWERLSLWDRKGEGFVTREELPHQFQLRVVHGQPGEALQLAEGVVLPVARTERAASGQVPKGPLWFRKMDRNGDGFVSRREFLGTSEDFKRIDADSDGLISPDEAERADSQLRQAKAK
jgi:Ca2+-binding EF-hand superfamily protein